MNLTKYKKPEMGFYHIRLKSGQKPKDDLKNLVSVMTFLFGAMFGSIGGVMFAYRDFGMMTNNELYLKSCLLSVFSGFCVYFLTRLVRES